MGDIIFYWSAWFIWIWATWVMEKSKLRLQVARFCLFAIIFSSYTLQMMDFQVNMGIFFFLFFSLSLILKEKFTQQCYLLICTIVIAQGYVALYLISLYDPVLFILPFYVLVVIYLIFVISILTKQLEQRIFLILSTIPLSEIVIGIILNYLTLYNGVGLDRFLTILSLSIFVTLVITPMNRFPSVTN